MCIRDSYTADHIFGYIELDEQHAIIEVAVPEDWRGHSISELDADKMCIRDSGYAISGSRRSPFCWRRRSCR